MNEEWRDIEGYEGLYQVSNLGRVKSLNYKRTKQEAILKYGYDKDGYKQVFLCKNGKSKVFKVHKLVAMAFILNANNYPQINHKDEDKNNNCVSNLEWCTNEHNINYGTRNNKVAKALSKKVTCITTREVFDSMQEASKKYNIPTANISNCCRGKRKTAGGYKWIYFKEEKVNE